MREAAKTMRESKLSRSERRERGLKCKEAAQRKFEETMEAVREFNEARAKEKEPPGGSGGLPGGSK